MWVPRGTLLELVPDIGTNAITMEPLRAIPVQAACAVSTSNSVFIRCRPFSPWILSFSSFNTQLD